MGYREGYTWVYNKTCEKTFVLLSVLSTVDDLLGSEAPFMLKGRLIILQLHQDTLRWDKQIDEKSPYGWLKWKNNPLALENVTVSKCYKPKDFGKNITYFLHHFLMQVRVDMGKAAL